MKKADNFIEVTGFQPEDFRDKHGDKTGRNKDILGVRRGTACRARTL